MGAQFFNDNFSQFLQDAANDAVQEMGRANFIIVGGAGVGKSTLINAVFQGNLATTGVGRPVTTSTRKYKKDGIPLSIFDTQGIEKDKFDDMLAELGKFLQERRVQTTISISILLGCVF
jgi:predicted GTPase